MNVQEVPLAGIDFDDETFRISEDLDPAPLQESLREVGQINPVVLLERDEPSAVIVCGFRRLRALRRAGKQSCRARFLPPDLSRPVSAFRIALWDNIALRPLEPLEKARALFVLKHACSMKQEEMVERYLPILGLEAHENVLQRYLGLHLLNPDLRRFVADGALAVASAEHLAGLSGSAQAAAAVLFSRARFSASLQRQLLDLIADLAAGDHTGVEDVLAKPEVLATLNDASLSSFQRGEAVFRILFRRRNPRLSAAEARFKAAKDRLGLPGAVRVSADPYFEKARLRVEFEAGSSPGFREIAASLQRAAQSPALDELFRVR